MYYILYIMYTRKYQTYKQKYLQLKNTKVQIASQKFEFEPENEESILINKAISLLKQINKINPVIIDLGPGNGRNIIKLLEEKSTVYAYDNDSNTINFLANKFNQYVENKQLHLFLKSFEDIDKLPNSDMIIAYRSLSFMQKDKFLYFWNKIICNIKPRTILVVTFFGTDHKTLRPINNFPLTRFTYKEIMNLTNDFYVFAFFEELELDIDVSNKFNTNQYEHIYKIILIKKDYKYTNMIDMINNLKN